jgi:hypothetical protein
MKKILSMLTLAIMLMLNVLTADRTFARSALTDGLVTKVDSSAGCCS